MLQTLKNKLIENEHFVGTKRISNWKLPPQSFAYGKKETEDKEGASKCKIKINKSVTRSWSIHNPSKDNGTRQNFIKLNKLAISTNCLDFKVKISLIFRLMQSLEG